jgi:hypothetical protein
MCGDRAALIRIADQNYNQRVGSDVSGVAHLVVLRQRLLGKIFPQMTEQFKDLEFESERETVVLCQRIQDR